MDSDSDSDENRRKNGLPPIVYVERKRKDPPPDLNAPPPPPSPYYAVDANIVVNMNWSFESLAAKALEESIGTNNNRWNIPDNDPRPADHIVKDARIFESAFLRGRTDEPLSAENRVHFNSGSSKSMMSVSDPISSICESIMKGAGTHINCNLFDRSVGDLYGTFSDKIGTELDSYRALSKFINEKTYRLIWVKSNQEKVNLGRSCQESVKAMIRYPESDGVAGLLKFCAILFQLIILLYAEGRVVTKRDYEVMKRVLGKWKGERG